MTRMQQGIIYSQNVFPEKSFDSRTVSCLQIRSVHRCIYKENAVAFYHVSHIRLCCLSVRDSHREETLSSEI